MELNKIKRQWKSKLLLFYQPGCFTQTDQIKGDHVSYQFQQGQQLQVLGGTGWKDIHLASLKNSQKVSWAVQKIYKQLCTMFFSVQDYSNGHIYNNLLWQCKHGDSCHFSPHRLSTSTPLHETELGHLCTLDSGTPMYNTWQATRLWECAAPLHGATEAVLDCWSCISTSALHMVELLIDCTIAALSLYHSGNPDFSRMTFAQKHRGGLAFAHFVQSLFLRLFKMTASQIAMANCIKLAKAKSSKFHARMHFFAVCTFLPVE